MGTHITEILLIATIFLLFNNLQCLNPNNNTQQDNDLNKRLSYMRKLMYEFSSDKLEVKYSQEQGMYCSTKQDIPSNSLLFKVSNEHIISSCKNNS